MYALKNKCSGPRMQINYYSNEHCAAENMIRLKEKVLGTNSYSDE